MSRRSRSRRRRLLMKPKDNRSRGIYQKNAFFVVRHPNPILGSYFTITTEKVICNPDEKCKFYLKVGAIAFLDKVEVPGQGHRESYQKIRESQHFGSYLFYNTTDKKLRVLSYAKRKHFSPGDVVISRPNVIHSVIPKYDGSLDSPRVVIGLKIDMDDNRTRKWERFDGNNKTEQHNGIHYLYEDDELDSLQFVNDANDAARKFKSITGIYVPEETTLVVVDGGRAYTHADYCNFLVYTVVQDGGIIMTNLDLFYIFYDEMDGEEAELDSHMVYKTKRDRFDCRNFNLLEDNKENKFLFLNSTPENTAWTLRICRVRRAMEFEAQLCVPSGGKFDIVMDLSDGIREVKKSHRMKPWKKYIEAYDEFSTRDKLPLIYLDDPSYPYPYPNPDAVHEHEPEPPEPRQEPRRQEEEKLGSIEQILARYRADNDL